MESRRSFLKKLGIGVATTAVVSPVITDGVHEETCLTLDGSTYLEAETLPIGGGIIEQSKNAERTVYVGKEAHRAMNDWLDKYNT